MERQKRGKASKKWKGGEGKEENILHGTAANSPWSVFPAKNITKTSKI
jgi:hypothetical protein